MVHTGALVRHLLKLRQLHRGRFVEHVGDQQWLEGYHRLVILRRSRGQICGLDCVYLNKIYIYKLKARP